VHRHDGLNCQNAATFSAHDLAPDVLLVGEVVLAAAMQSDHFSPRLSCGILAPSCHRLLNAG
jgi:hypothetical protein